MTRAELLGVLVVAPLARLIGCEPVIGPCTFSNPLVGPMVQRGTVEVEGSHGNKLFRESLGELRKRDAQFRERQVEIRDLLSRGLITTADARDRVRRSASIYNACLP